MGVPFVLPILKAILGHLYFAWIHPFGDGNGRTARLLEFDILTRAGVPTASAHLLSDYYNKTRPLYYRELSRARQDQTHFIQYAVQGFVDGLREQLVTIREQQMSVTWMNYVFRTFRKEAHTDAMTRRREVAIALSFEAEPVWPEDVPSLSPKLAEQYGPRHERTLSRDIDALFEMQLIVATPEGGIFANTALVTAFLPLARRATVPVAPTRAAEPETSEEVEAMAAQPSERPFG
jgi:Fic/DOC family